MIKENKSLSFSNIAREAGVSISYLYKYPEIKERIQYLRKQQSQTKKTSSPQPASDKSKVVITKQFKERIKKLEAERDGLRKAIEGLTGRLYQYQGIEEQLEKIKVDNTDLKQQLEEYRSRHNSPKNEGTVNIFQKQNEKLSLEIERLTQENVELKNKLARNTLKSTNKVTQVKRPTIPIPDSVKADLKELNIKINSTLRRLIRENPEEVILESIAAFKYAIKKNEVKNPGGFLVKAIKYRWKAPEDSLQEMGTTTQQESEYKFPEDFEEWFLEAIDSGFIINESPFELSRNTKGDLLVKVNRPSASGLPYSQMSWIEAKNLMELS
ncbi:MAG: hypothetical protein IGS23_14390 [Rivularia sp. T60_A2020_040]|nr:hypothetical protein [Rivularia sp. T60_A2020_040]